MERGSISFARFMQLALYHPKYGYYESETRPIGRTGDFYTNVSTGPVFGELLCYQFVQWVLKLDRPRAQLVEAGAHNGALARDILNGLQILRPEMSGKLDYWIIEPSPQRRATQQETLKEFSTRVTWFDDWRDIPREGVHGVIFSNELLDAFPVRRFGWDAATRAWFEWGVACENESFVWTRLPLRSDSNTEDANEFPPDLPDELKSVLPDGFTIETNRTASDWWRAAARALRKGKLLTIDYGLTSGEIFVPGRKDGTVRAYHQHRFAENILARPGEQDITAQVNFSALQETGEAAGLSTDGLFSQAAFLSGIFEQTVNEREEFTPWTPARLRQFKTLIHPEHLGRSFKVLIQSR